ncbi:uncharacterized protein SPSK_05746 [Sporothrix schenckii 1099-18]|uniref:Uncharacterized protein n=1 Tax=Sporothrix schenckii 1099-18 TaxID=1397361 RepID=A0A0F2LUD8_SPOSC|nr:uncharacterized protein SPSK_05746 [Sporothrix schenckii 1099-18]KJR80449.1 hypothetical protein SPSK_05746 [Sporothrix schenckii 1099-18]
MKNPAVKEREETGDSLHPVRPHVALMDESQEKEHGFFLVLVLEGQLVGTGGPATKGNDDRVSSPSVAAHKIDGRSERKKKIFTDRR